MNISATSLTERTAAILHGQTRYQVAMHARLHWRAMVLIERLVWLPKNPARAVRWATVYADRCAERSRARITRRRVQAAIWRVFASNLNPNPR